jgi:hypothetical protein
MRLQSIIALCCFVTVAADAASPRELTGREYSEATLLLSESDADVKVAGISLHKPGSDRRGILDLLAEVTWTACAGDRSLDPDTLAWLAKALGRTRQARYAAVLDHCLANVGNEKVTKHVKLARDNLTGAAAEAFTGGSVNLAQWRERLAKEGRRAPREQIARQFDAVHQGQPLDEVFAGLGVPDRLRGDRIHGKTAGHRYVKVKTSQDQIVFDYSGLGTVRFLFDFENSRWALASAESEGDLIWNWGSGRFGTYDDLIDTGGPAELRRVVNRLKRETDIERDTLDRIVSRIYRSRAEKNEHLVDALSHLCRVVGRTGDGRYKQAVFEISRTAAARDLRKHCGKAADDLPETSDEKFLPASG